MSMREKHFMDPRRSGCVLRYHTYPTIQQQSVGEHSWQVMRVLHAIWPEVPRHLLSHALNHDCGELRVGDLPYPSKGEATLPWREELEDLERRAILSMCVPWGLPPPVPLTQPEKAAFKLAEYIEMMEFALTELNLGNRYAELIRLRCMEAIRGLVCSPDLVPEVARAALAYTAKRERWEGDIHD